MSNTMQFKKTPFNSTMNQSQKVMLNSMSERFADTMKIPDSDIKL